MNKHILGIWEVEKEGSNKIATVYFWGNIEIYIGFNP